MQIHEITLRKQQPVTEGPLFDKIKAAAGDLSRDPTFANADYNARLKILANNRVLDTIAKQAFSSWQAKHAQLVKTKGGPLAPQEAKEQVTALVKQTMLPPYTELDNLVNGQQIQKTIDGFVAQFNAGNMDMAEQAMGTLAELGAAAVTTRQAQGTGPGAGQASPGAAQSTPGAAQSPSATSSSLINPKTGQPFGGGAAQQQQAAPAASAQAMTPAALQAELAQDRIQITPTLATSFKQWMYNRQIDANVGKSTGNAHADALLRLFGFNL